MKRGRDYKRKFRNCEQNFKEKLFLASFDILTLNLSSRILYQLYMVLDFIFLAHFPLDQIYNRSKSSKETHHKLQYYIGLGVAYMNPADKAFEEMHYEDTKKVQLCLIIYSFIILAVLLALILTRNKKKLNISSHRKLVNKVQGLVLSITNFLLFVPIVSFLSQTFHCSPHEPSCYSDSHLALLCFAVIAIIIYTILMIFQHSLMTSSYPNEKIPWAHFPSKLPYEKMIIRLAVILVYEIDTERVTVAYFNAFFAIAMVASVYQRMTKAMTFDRTIHIMNIIMESIMVLVYFLAFLSDLLGIYLGILFFFSLLVGIIGVGVFVNKLREWFAEKFLKKVDIFNYRKEFEALHMMIALHELIEMSGFSDREDFLLRGFVERHIEICDFPQCNCMDYYKIINSAYRIQLATIATMKEDDNNKSSIHNTNRTTYDDETTQDDNSMQKTFFVQTKNLTKQNKAKTKFMNMFLINNIKVFLEMFPNSVKLRYMSAFIYFNLFKNSFKALYELSYTKTLKSSLGDSYDSYTLGLKIIEYFALRVNSFLSKENKILDLEIDLAQIIEFEKLNIRYQKSIEQTSEITEQFWLELNKKNLNIDNIFNLGSTINSQFHQIKKKYKKLMGINGNYLEVAYLYKLFVQLCLNYELEESEAKMEITKILQAKGMRKRNLRLEYSRINFSDENGMIIISGCQKDFSKILAMNNKAERIFGYSTAELINNSLTKLQPLVYGYSHDDFILNYINSKRKIKKDQHSFVWGKHKSGFIMPIVMDISPYVTFEYNLCFIAFCKRSILLEMTPLKEILDAQDVFVLLADQKGLITDMTRNITDWLGFPLQALNKDISLEQIFDGILEDEFEKEFVDGKRIDFFMNSFKDALDDFENRSEDELESTLYMKDKKCRALVWMKLHEYQLATHQTIQPVNNGIVTGSAFIGTMGGGGQVAVSHPNNTLQVREIWFVLLEEEAATATATASFLDTKNTHESGLEKEELKFTYQEDREEISSLASISSLAGYGNTDKGLISKLSEIKTSTVEEQKPRSISFLQQTLLVVFLLSVISAVFMLIFALLKDQAFFQELTLINSAKISSIKYQNLQIILRELVNIANGDEDNNISFIDGNVSTFLQDYLVKQSDLFRKYQNDLDDPDLQINSQQYEDFKQKSVVLHFIRQDGQYYQDTKSFSLAYYELITLCQEIGLLKDFQQVSLNRKVLHKHITNDNDQYTTYAQLKGILLSEIQRQVFFLLDNLNAPVMNFYPMLLSEFYISNSGSNLMFNSNVFLGITIAAIAITLVTAILIIPIILRIESNKEKVFFIYAELSKNDVDDRKRNIRIFFAKLRQSTNNPGGSLFYQKSSRIVSSKLLTKKFSMKDESNQLGTLGLTRQPALGEKGNTQTMKNNEDYEEDLKAELMKQQEELEAAVFKKFFHKKIKAMSCIKKLKYICLVLFFAGLVQGYFLIENSLINQIGQSIEESLDYYRIITSRDTYFSELIAYFRESVARNDTLQMRVGDLETNDNQTIVSTIDYFMEQVMENEKHYNSLRKSLPGILSASSAFITQIEGEGLCQIPQVGNQTMCQTALDGILKTGMTQTINTMVKQIIQDQINFNNNRKSETSIKALINNSKIRSIIYLKLIFMDNAMEQLISSTTDSIQAAFKQMERTIIILFVCFVIIMVVGVAISTTWGMNFLYRNFNATKSILNFIPGKCLIELSEKTDLKKIQF